jgi:hypothetical protein
VVAGGLLTRSGKRYAAWQRALARPAAGADSDG